MGCVGEEVRRKRKCEELTLLILRAVNWFGVGLSVVLCSDSIKKTALREERTERLREGVGGREGRLTSSSVVLSCVQVDVVWSWKKKGEKGMVFCVVIQLCVVVIS